MHACETEEVQQAGYRGSILVVESPLFWITNQLPVSYPQSGDAILWTSLTISNTNMLWLMLVSLHSIRPV